MGFSSGDGVVHTIGKVIVRSLQFVLALTVAGIYGNHVDNQRKNNNPANPAFTFAVVVGGLSCTSAIIFNIPKVKAYHVFAWDWLMTIFWLAIFGKFAAVFLPLDPNNPKASYESTNTQQMKNVVWVDLINMFLWFITATYGTFLFVRHRRQSKVEFVEEGQAPMREVGGEPVPEQEAHVSDQYHGQFYSH